jgi:hypothetical protein
MTTKDDIKAFCDSKLEGLKPYFTKIEEISKQFYTDADIMSFPQYGPLENRLVGMFTFINTVYKELDALTDTYSAVRFNQLKVKAEIDSIKFVADVAKHDAQEFTSDLRLTRAILEGYVHNIEQLLATCRRHLYVTKKEQHYG